MPHVSAKEGSMKAAQFNIHTKKVIVNEIPIPVCRDNEILIKNKCASLCHSDLMNFWGHSAPEMIEDDVTIGHENTGIVTAMGKGVTGFKIGDKVGCLGCSYACYECEGCQTHNLLCEAGTGKMHGFDTAGHFAEYSISDYRNAMVLPEDADMVSAAPLFCAGVTAYHAVTQCELKSGDWIAAIGCGGLGHLGIQYAKAKNLKVIAIDVSEAQLENAKALGADLTYNSMTDPDYVQNLKKATNGGAHAAIIFSAAQAAYINAPKILRSNGLMMVVGIPQKDLSFNALDILLGRYRIKGASSGTPQRMKEPILFSLEHNIKPHMKTFEGLDHINEIIELMKDGKSAGRFGITF
ncbi:hypothetical protein BP6252_04992 [Coleophoma cylindrospora]|uniref:Enoyl reductase (ER) domain-containing protein n=1 Tax=Coleophoma cylindrospora TaxID=1849047 RepID=A0A3D8RSC2_9HELO|nr:hypothetical protein BP6252_04992 [Coleophoma cylindrospora]